MEKFKGKYRIESTRLQNWDYGWNAAYFITINTQNRLHYFGEIVNGEMILSEIGHLTEKYWHEIPQHFPFVRLDAFVVMPNHVHGIIVIDKHDDGNGESDNIGDHNGLDGNVYGDNDNDNVHNDNDNVHDGNDDNDNDNDGDDDNDHRDIDNNDNNGNNGDDGDDNGDNVETRHCLVSTIPPTIPTIPTIPPTDSPTTNVVDSNSPTDTINAHHENELKTIGQKRFQNQGKNTLSSIIGSYKSVITKHARKIHADFAWQSRFHDHIIRDDASYQRIKNYIDNNPKKWDDDTFNNSHER